MLHAAWEMVVGAGSVEHEAQPGIVSIASEKYSRDMVLYLTYAR